MSSAFSKKLLVAALSSRACSSSRPARWAQSSSTSGGATFVPPPPPPAKGALVDGRLIAPASAPRRVKQVIAAANRIVEKPYVYGGGHTAYRARPASTAAMTAPAPSPTRSTAAASCAPRCRAGCSCAGASAVPGRWITVYAHGGHAYVVVAGYRFDTSMRDRDAPGPSTGPRWSRTLRTSSAFVARHPSGY